MIGAAGRAGLVVAVWLVGALPAVAADVSERLTTCLACHGADGSSQTADVPSLGAQQRNYVITQLFLFREQMRVSSPMNDMAKGLSDDDLQAIAAKLAALPAPKPPGEPGDAARMAAAQALAQQNHCNVCHRPDFAGQDNVPRIADQREDYVLKTLREYKSGARHGYEPTMAEVVQPLEDAQLVELAYYLAHFR